ncbi:hypothetical protein Ancab_019943 [Ancistrocladus abbreviatus]
MDKEFFLNAGIPRPLQFDQPPLLSSAMPAWQPLSSAMQIHNSELNCPLDQSSDCFLTDASHNFESALSSMVSSPSAAVSNSAMSGGSFMIRELIGKLGNICNSGEISPPAMNRVNQPARSYIGGSASNNDSCYCTPLSSPPKISMPITDHLVKENFTKLGNSIPLTSNLPAMPVDPGFAQRAARFSSFGSRSFNGRTCQFRLNNGAELPHRSTPFGGIGKLSRVSSSPSLKAAGSQMGNQENRNYPLHVGNEMETGPNSGSILGNDRKISRLAGNSASDEAELANSRENSLVSEQNQAGNDSTTRKRKAVPKGKSKEISSSSLATSTKVAENDEDSSAKRSKSNEGNGNEGKIGIAGKEKEDESKKQSNNTNQKPPEPPKDYIHVRARRGQATDSHSLAERVRREKISERMKLLQDLVPGCNKVTGKALMLDEIINYVQSLQRQVEFLSMKLASVNPRMEFNMDNVFSKDAVQPSSSLPQPIFPLDTLVPTIYGGQQPHQTSLQNNITTAAMNPSMDSLQTALHQNHVLQLLPIDGFTDGVPQLPTLCEDDLQTIIQMGFGQDLSAESTFHPEIFHNGLYDGEPLDSKW